MEVEMVGEDEVLPHIKWRNLKLWVGAVKTLCVCVCVFMSVCAADQC